MQPDQPQPIPQQPQPAPPSPQPVPSQPQPVTPPAQPIVPQPPFTPNVSPPHVPIPPVGPPPPSSTLAEPQFLGAFALFKPSIKAIGYNIWTYLLLLLSAAVSAILVVTIAIAAVGIKTKVGESTPIHTYIALAVVCVILVLIIYSVVSGAIIVTGLGGVRHQKVKFRYALGIGLRKAPRLFVVILITGVLIGFGFILLIIPGLIMYRRYILASYYLVDKNLGAFAAIDASYQDSKKFKRPLWGLVGVEILLILVGLIPLMGRLISGVLGILYGFAPAKRYDEIQNALRDVPLAPAQAGPAAANPSQPIFS